MSGRQRPAAALCFRAKREGASKRIPPAAAARSVSSGMQWRKRPAAAARWGFLQVCSWVGVSSGMQLGGGQPIFTDTVCFLHFRDDFYRKLLQIHA